MSTTTSTTKNETDAHHRSRKLSLCLHLPSLFPLAPTSPTSPNGNGLGISFPRSSRANKLTLFFDAMVLNYRLYANSCESTTNAATRAILTLIDPDEKYFEPYGTQPATENTTLHLGQELDVNHLCMENYIYLRPLADTKHSLQDVPLKTDTSHTHHLQDLDDLTKTLSSLYQQYHADNEDVGSVTKAWKQQVLKGVICTFSGLIPSDQDPPTCRFWQLAITYGADCSLELTGKVTHLIASRTGTTKVNKAKHYQQRIHSVTVGWLLDSVARGYAQEEEGYPLISSLPASTVVTPVTTPLGNEDDLLEELDTTSHQPPPSLHQPPIDNNNNQEEEIHDINYIDWDEADREVNDYMNESGTDDNYSSGPDSPVPDSNNKGQTPTSRKRKRAAVSPLALRRAKTAERGPSRLSTMVNMNSGHEEEEETDDTLSSSSSSSSLSSFAGELDDEIE